MTLFQTLLDETIADFQKQYRSKPKWLVFAPGRVNLIGEHTDYNDGFVFPMAIERYTIIAAGPSQNVPERNDKNQKIAQIRTKNLNQTSSFLLEGEIQPAEKVRWSSYVQGSIACSLEKELNVEPFCAVLNSNVPIGGSLSSSASLEVAVATLMEAMSGQTLNPVDKALLCQKAEHLFAKMPCGIMDQFISTLGVKDHAMLLDCRSLVPKMIPLLDPSIVVLITNSNVKHSLTGSEYPERRQSCEEASRILGVTKLRDVSPDMLESSREKLLGLENGDRYYRRAKHVVSEDIRTQTMAQALIAADWEKVGEQMYASHESLKIDYEVSCPELDVLVDIAKSIGFDGGMIGSRMTGGGFGGCMVSLVRADQVDDVSETIRTGYFSKTGIKPTIFATRPAQGASILEQ